VKRITAVAIACAFAGAACSDKAQDTNTSVATTTETTIDATGTASTSQAGDAGAAASPGAAGLPGGAALPGTGTDGVRFDPSTIARGQRFTELLAEEATLQQAAALPGKPYLGRVRFSGTVDLTGKLVANTSSAGKDTARTAPCFVPDAKSTAKLPRMLGDDKPVTICFYNVDANQMLGQLAPPDPASIRISGYVISYARGVERNTAALLFVAEPRAK
jgi:hypothetical protein